MRCATVYSRPGTTRVPGLLPVRSVTWRVADARCLLRPICRIIAGAGTAGGTSVGVAVLPRIRGVFGAAGALGAVRPLGFSGMLGVG